MAANKASKTLFRLALLIAISSSVTNSQNKTGTQERVNLGFIWENPRIEKHTAEEVLVDGKSQELRLICILHPSLPVTKENFLARDKIVKWTRIKKTHSHQLTDTFWSDDQTITAVSLSHLNLRQLGTYGCSYKGFLRTINITVSNVGEVKLLPQPTLHSDLEGVVMNIKDRNGLDRWKSFPFEQNDKLGMAFPCSVPSSVQATPSSVHRLRPSDIDIVMSLGGAISAGVSANSSTVPDLFSSHKTLSFSFGGRLPVDRMVTIPSILKKFNPNLKGAVVKEESFTTMHYGSSLRHLPSRVMGLAKKLENRQDIDFKLSWKILTLSLDFDDYCVACRIKTQWDERIKAIIEALDILYVKMPRVYVNLLLPPNITQLYTTDESRLCPRLYRKPCECLESASATDRNDVTLMIDDLKNHITKVVKKYSGRTDFAVVIQPFWSEISASQKNLLAKDCFHFSLSGHEYAAVNLWNNMLQPINQKNTRWKFEKKILCPTENHPYLFTNINSPMDAVIDLSVNSNPKTVKKSSSKKKIALGIGLTLFILIVLAAIVFTSRKYKRISLNSKIRILARPWKRMKEKI